MKDILSVFNNQKEYFCTGAVFNIKGSGESDKEDPY